MSLCCVGLVGQSNQPLYIESFGLPPAKPQQCHCSGVGNGSTGQSERLSLLMQLSTLGISTVGLLEISSTATGHDNSSSGSSSDPQRSEQKDDTTSDASSQPAGVCTCAARDTDRSRRDLHLHELVYAAIDAVEEKLRRFNHHASFRPHGREIQHGPAPRPVVSPLSSGLSPSPVRPPIRMGGGAGAGLLSSPGSPAPIMSSPGDALSPGMPVDSASPAPRHPVHATWLRSPSRVPARQAGGMASSPVPPRPTTLSPGWSAGSPVPPRVVPRLSGTRTAIPLTAREVRLPTRLNQPGGSASGGGGRSRGGGSGGNGKSGSSGGGQGAGPNPKSGNSGILSRGPTPSAHSTGPNSSSGSGSGPGGEPQGLFLGLLMSSHSLEVYARVSNSRVKFLAVVDRAQPWRGGKGKSRSGGQQQSKGAVGRGPQRAPRIWVKQFLSQVHAAYVDVSCNPFLVTQAPVAGTSFPRRLEKLVRATMEDVFA